MDEPTEFNPRRRLCPDGTCTGIIGGDGRCGECGRLAGSAGTPVGDAPTLAGAADAEFLQSDVPDGGGPGDAVFAGASVEDAAGSPTFDPNRRLCEDGTCVGVIGPSGACVICGRRAGR